MKKINYILLFTLLALGLMVVGCTDRTNPTDFPKINQRDFGSDGVFSQKRAFNTISSHATFEPLTLNSPEKSFQLRYYTPPNYRDAGTPFPVLYLLHDFAGDENYYFSRMIHRIADSLIYENEIDEFYIVTVGATTAYGGCWHNNNDFYGWFEDMITVDLINFIEQDIPALKTSQSRAGRAIGGFGMGGYGALKLSAKNPELYSSVSTSNCAGKFDGEGSLRGVDELIPLMLAEQDLATPIDNFITAFDTTGMTLGEKPYTLLFFSMAQAFSPHPTDESDPLFADSTTFLGKMGIDLPFDYNGNLYQPVWDKWVAGGLDNILTANAGHFDSIALYMEYNDADQFYFNEQAQAIIDLCDQLGIDFKQDNYSGFNGMDADNQTFIYDRLVGILKFHSKNFETNF